MFTKVNIIKMVLGVIFGGLLGYTFYFFFGCRSGCPITSNWITSVIYGAIFGAIIVFPTKRGKDAGNN